ncbi:tumor necrosis factor receptor superfamily member 16 isoform X6 [Pocillopora verrucosa]|uniref:tumor necrosis factor receptor superfamily member 16 isoform X6 n=1 Tax=Pocillopora verrucosa TaxID=203993 RepID=UPI00333F031C
MHLSFKNGLILLLILWSRSVSGRPARCSLAQNFLRYFPDAPEAQMECKACPKCPAGMGLTPLCGSKISNYTIIKCEPCRENVTFSETHSIESCRPCHDCGLRNIIQQCTLYQNRRCGNKCPERHFLGDNGFCHECYFCCSNIPESSRLKNCKDIGMSRDWQCLKSQTNGLCKEIREKNAENATSTTHDVTTPTSSADLAVFDFNLNLTGMVSSEEDTRKPVFKSEKNNSLPATTKTGTDKRSTKEEGETVTSTFIVLIAIGTAIIFFLGAIIYYCFKRSHPNVTNSNERIPLRGMQGAEDRDVSTETAEEGNDNQEPLISELRQDQPKTDLIPASEVYILPFDCKVSEMPQLHNHENQILLHYVQRMLDPLEKQTKKNWRSVGQTLNVSEEDLDLIDTDYRAGRSPTVSLIGKLSTFLTVPSMRSFVEALITCKRYDVATHICNWPWELRTIQ